MNKRAVRLFAALLCAAVAAFALVWFVPPEPRLTPENIARVHPDMTGDEAIELFGCPAVQQPLEEGGRELRWVEDQVLFGVRLREDGKVVGIRWEKDREPEGFWSKLRRRLRL